MRARVISAFVAILIAMFWGAPQSVEYLCGAEAPVHKCCCPHGEDEAKTVASVQRPPCCVAEEDFAPGADAGLAPASSPHKVMAVVDTHLAVNALSPGTPTQAGLPLARGPPDASAPPIYLRDCRFLI